MSFCPVTAALVVYTWPRASMQRTSPIVLLAGRKQQKILGKAARRWQGAAQLLARPKQSSKVSGACAAALQSFLADAAARAAGARASVRRPVSP